MKVLIAFWLAATSIGFATRDRDNVVEYSRNTTGCLPATAERDTDVPLMAPVSTIAAWCILQVAFAQPATAGFAALVAVTLTFMFAERLAGTDKLGPSAAAALTANAAICWLSGKHGQSETAAGSRAVFAGVATYLGLVETTLLVPAIAALVPVVAVAVDRSDSTATVPLATLCGTAATVLFMSAERDAGVCSNDVALYQRQDWIHGFGLYLWAAAISVLVGEHQRECQKAALGATAVAALALAAAGFENGWQTLGFTAAGASAIAEVCDELHIKVPDVVKPSVWRITLT